jgi:hypothetical protein
MREPLSVEQVQCRFRELRIKQWQVGLLALACYTAYPFFCNGTPDGMRFGLVLSSAFVLSHAWLRWRCPACNAFLGLLGWSGPEACSGCGVTLRDE